MRNMPSSLTRRRLKDRIIDSVSRAVKKIQEWQYETQGACIFSNHDWQFQRLCDHLDHAFLHGLRHVTNGYWVVVQEFTHKATVKDIKRLSNVTTNLGRGRAWLFMALSDHLLESYMRCFLNNTNMVRKHYVKDALVLDQQRLQILVTLASGLEFVTFQVDLDVAYLDLGCSLRKRSDSEDSEDRLSLCSMESSVSQSSSMTFSGRDDNELTSHANSDAHSISSNSSGLPRVNSDSPLSTLMEEQPYFEDEQARIARISNLSISDLDALDPSKNSIMVTRVKVKRSKKKKEQKSLKDGSDPNSNDAKSSDKNTEPVQISRENSSDFEVIASPTESSTSKLSFTESLKDKFESSLTTLSGSVENGLAGSGQVMNQSQAPKIASQNETCANDSCKKQDCPPGGPSVASIPCCRVTESQNPVTTIQFDSEISWGNQEILREDGDFVYKTDEGGCNCSCSCEPSSSKDHANQCGQSDNMTERHSNGERLSVIYLCDDPTTPHGIYTPVAPSLASKSGLEGNKLLCNPSPSKHLFASPRLKLQNDAMSNSPVTQNDVCLNVPVPVINEQGTSLNVNVPVINGQGASLNVNVPVIDEEGTSLSAPTIETEKNGTQPAESDTSQTRNQMQKDSASPHDAENVTSNCNKQVTVSDSKTSSAFVIPTVCIDVVSSPSPTDSVPDSPFTETSGGHTKDYLTVPPKLVPGEIRRKHSSCVDNNMKLLLMLDIFQEEEEQFLKLYATSVGHTEGQVVYVFLMLTSHAIYILRKSLEEGKFITEAIVRHSEVDYLSLSINYQVINIVCINRRKQFWITTGDEELTKSIVGQLDLAIRQTHHPHLSVLTDATTQKIAMRKWAAGECGMQPNEVSIVCDMLVHWEDLSKTADISPVAANKQGTLYYRQESGNVLTRLWNYSSWKEGYFILRDGSLQLYQDQNDTQLPKLCVQLNCEDCVGCRRANKKDRKHAFDIIQSDGSILELSAANDAELQDWLQALCIAVAQETKGGPKRAVCEACCCVVTQSHVLMCHEDTQSHFLRTLSKLDVTDITGITTGGPGDSYLLINIDADKQKQTWALYLVSHTEADRLLQSLVSTWSSIYQVALPVQENTDAELMTHCEESTARLKPKAQLHN